MSFKSEIGGVEHAAGDPAEHLDELVGRLYDELRQIARQHRRGGRGNLTLQTTALVHEAYLRMARSDAELSLQDQRHLKALTSRIIRHIMVDYARRAGAAKRDVVNAPPGRIEDSLIEPMLDVGILDLDAALHRLAGHSPRLETIVECRFFGGMNVQETADAMSLSPRTVERDWRKAKVYLLRFLDEEKSDSCA